MTRKQCLPRQSTRSRASSRSFAILQKRHPLAFVGLLNEEIYADLHGENRRFMASLGQLSKEYVVCSREKAACNGEQASLLTPYSVLPTLCAFLISQEISQVG